MPVWHQVADRQEQDLEGVAMVDEAAMWNHYGPGAQARAQGEVVFKEGKPSEHESGVLYQGPWETAYDGFSEHTRRCARALAMTGMPVHLRSMRPSVRYGMTPEDRAIDEQYQDLLMTSIGRYAVQIHQVVAEQGIFTNLVSKEFRTSDGLISEEEQQAINSRRILSTVYESWGVADGDVQSMNRAGQVWVACEANASMLRDAGVERVRVIPIPHFPDDPALKLYGAPRVAGPVRFYHIGKWEPRKEQRSILLAFFRAFRPGEAHLYVKTSPGAPKWAGYPQSPEVAISSIFQDSAVVANGWDEAKLNRNVFLMRNMLTVEQIVQLHRSCDVYCTLARGEGFDMPAYDAKLAGKLMVYTPSGGPQDFADETDELVPRTGMVACNPFYRLGKSQCIDYSIDDAVAAMQRARARVLAGHRVSAERPSPLHARMSAAAVGSLMRDHVLELAEELRAR